MRILANLKVIQGGIISLGMFKKFPCQIIKIISVINTMNIIYMSDGLMAISWIYFA